MAYIVITTTDKKEEAELIAESLLKKRLAACVQIMRINSMYWWKGNIEKANEYLCFIKTKENLYKEVEEHIKNMHSYTVPEIIALKVEKGIPSYLEWLKSETKE